MKITPQDQRRPVGLGAATSFRAIASLPVGLEVFFERSQKPELRGGRCHTGRSPACPRAPARACSGNVGSLLTFKAMGYDEAARLARELPGLQRHRTSCRSAALKCAARINTGGLGSGSAVVTGRTEPLPPVTGQAAVYPCPESAARYGTDPARGRGRAAPPQPEPTRPAMK